MSEELPEPYVPDEFTAVIDLTSEPESPSTESAKNLQKAVESGCLDSELPEPPGFNMFSSPVEGLPYPGPVLEKPEHLKIDVPIMSVGSSTPSSIGVLGKPDLASPVNIDEALAEMEEVDCHFTDAFSALIEERHSEIMLAIDQEHLDPSDSIARMPVPKLLIELSAPEWEKHSSSGRAQFDWLMSSSHLSLIDIKIAAAYIPSNNTVKWEPIPQGKGRIVTDEALQTLDSELPMLRVADEMHSLNSAAYIECNRDVRILCKTYDDDIRSLSNSPVPLSAEYLYRRQQSEDAPRQSIEANSLEDMIREARKRLPNEPSADLSGDQTATRLLSGFMELRASKRHKTAEVTKPNPRAEGVASHSNNQVALVQQNSPPKELRSSLIDVPRVAEPVAKGCFIVSLGLSRTILRLIARTWPAQLLIDRDLSREGKVVVSAMPSKSSDLPVECDFEVDVALSPTSGLIVTTLLQARQRPLPGSKALPPLRQRIQAASYRYESLVILVSESNPAGEVMGSPSPADVAAYADLVRFTTSLKHDTIPYLIPGGDEALAGWIISFMNLYSPHTAPVKDYLSHQETT
ncbi:hypothetical protein B0I35DRAFT_222261 [Stachybotrys elegans]|uniref:DUF7102 domain-containing protein n=1 Tax=Stachybotrys elegans TaxID=80388 RepID=A0A8K0SRA0_9HYPO|nr:hypothetical protein B0I35DRAFT_222261 [Stachybotrys elegans]